MGKTAVFLRLQGQKFKEEYLPTDEIQVSRGQNISPSSGGFRGRHGGASIPFCGKYNSCQNSLIWQFDIRAPLPFSKARSATALLDIKVFRLPVIG